MARPPRSSRIQVWVPDNIAEAFEMLAADGMLTPSDHIRLALSNHLRSLGINPSSPRQANGQQHQKEAQRGL
jgi:hypothetical protein